MPAIFKGISQKVKDIDDPTIGTGSVFFNIRGVLKEMVPGKFKYICVHHKDEHITSYPQLKLVLIFLIKLKRDLVFRVDLL